MAKTSASENGDSLLRHPGFVRFWCTRVASSFAYQMVSVAVGWQIYALTHRALDLGIIGLVQFLPALLLALPAGHMADRYERRRMVIACQALECAAMMALAIGTLFRWFDEPAILAMILVIGCAK